MKRRQLPRCTAKGEMKGIRGVDVYRGMIIKAVADRPGIGYFDLLSLLGEAKVVNGRPDIRFGVNNLALSTALGTLVDDRSLVEYVPVTSWLYSKITSGMAEARYKLGRKVNA